MLFHAARLEARLDEEGFVLLMEDQDRTKWDERRKSTRAGTFSDQSGGEGTIVSPFHLEAGIALYHCSAKSYSETDWPAILRAVRCAPAHFIDRRFTCLTAPIVIGAEIEGPGAGIRRVARNQNKSRPLRHYPLV